MHSSIGVASLGEDVTDVCGDCIEADAEHDLRTDGWSVRINL